MIEVAPQWNREIEKVFAYLMYINLNSSKSIEYIHLSHHIYL